MRVALILSLMLMGIGNTFSRDNKSAGVEIIVGGTTIPKYSHKGKTYIEAIKGKEYSIRISNPLGERVAVALSVDGLNTIDAKQTKPPKAAKWVLEPYQSIVIHGWQVSDLQARQFFFTTEDQSYGAKLGKTENFGLISAAFFKERRQRVYEPPYLPRSPYPPLPPFPPYPRYPPSPYPWPGMMGGGMGGMGGGGGFGSGGAASGAPGIAPGVPPAQSSPIAREAPDASADKTTSQKSEPEYAATGMGNRVDHEVERVTINLEDKPFATLNLRYEFRPVLVKLGVPIDRPIVKDPLLRREKAKGFGDAEYCPE